MSEPAIQIEGLRKTYPTLRGPVEALRGLDLEVRRGEILGYVGVNGAGKSTSIKILLGLVQPSGGTARVFGHPAGSLQARRHIGYLPEVANYHEFMSAEELLRVHARLAQVDSKHIERRCDEALAAVGLSERRRSRISEFSKGMKQRFGIAQALVAEPPLLILDELTSGLDPFAQKDLRDIMLTLKGRGITVFFSSHHMSEVESLCDRAAIIHRGVLRACGTIDELTRADEQHEVELIVPPEQAAELIPLGWVATGAPDRLRTVVAAAELRNTLSLALTRGCEVARLVPLRHSLEEVFHAITRTPEPTAA